MAERVTKQLGLLSVTKRGEGAPASVTSVVPATVPAMSRGLQLADMFTKAGAAERAASKVLENTDPMDGETRKIAGLAHETVYDVYKETEKPLIEAIEDATRVLGKTVGMCSEEVLPTERGIVAGETKVESYRVDMLPRSPYKIAHRLGPLDVRIAELFEIGVPGEPLAAVVRKIWNVRRGQGGDYGVESVNSLYLGDPENGGIIQIRWSSSDSEDSEPTVTLKKYEQIELGDVKAITNHAKILPGSSSTPTTISVEGQFMPNITEISGDEVALGTMLDCVFRAAASDDVAKGLVAGEYKVRPPQE